MKKDEKNSLKPEIDWFDLITDYHKWSRVKDDYKLIVDAMDKIPISEVIDRTVEFLNQANKYLLPGHNFIFDGTTSCLRYLVENKYINIDLTAEDGLKNLMLKHLYRPQETQGIYVSPIPYSSSVLFCKGIVVNLYLLNDKLKVFSTCTETIEMFEKLTEQDLFQGRTEKTACYNNVWHGLVGNRPWNQKKARTLAQLLQERLQESLSSDSPMYQVFIRLQPRINKIVSKEIPDFDEKHPTFLAVRHASIIVLYKTLVNYSDEAVRYPDIHFGTGIDQMLDEIVQHIFRPELEFQGWFLEYFDREMAKRVRLIKILNEENFVSPFFPGKRVVMYSPVLDNFRFMSEGEAYLVKGLVPIFRSNQLSIEEKDEIAKQIVFNIQKLILGITPVDRKYEKTVKDALEMLMVSILEPLAKRIREGSYRWANKKGDFKKRSTDTSQTIILETLNAILEYDASINSSFFGYIKTMLRLRVNTELRQKKIETMTEPVGEVLKDFSESDGLWGGFLDVEQWIDQSKVSKVIESRLNTLSPKERKVLEKAYYNNERLTETERRMKNRALQKLRKQHPEDRELLSEL